MPGRSYRTAIVTAAGADSISDLQATVCAHAIVIAVVADVSSEAIIRTTPKIEAGVDRVVERNITGGGAVGVRIGHRTPSHTYTEILVAEVAAADRAAPHEAL